MLYHHQATWVQNWAERAGCLCSVHCISIHRLCGPAIYGGLLAQQERTGSRLSGVLLQEFGQEHLSHPCRALSGDSAGFHHFMVILHLNQYILQCSELDFNLWGDVFTFLCSLLLVFLGVWASSGRAQEQPQHHGWNGEKIWFCWNQTMSSLGFTLLILSLILLLGEWVTGCLVLGCLLGLNCDANGGIPKAAPRQRHTSRDAGTMELSES